MAELAQPAIGTPARPVARLRWGPAATVVTAAVALIVIIFAIFGFLIWQAYWQTLTQARGQAQAAADVVASETELMVGGALATLQQVATIAQTPADVTPDIKAAFDRSIQNLPAATSLGLYDATGNAWADAGAAGLPENISGMDLFKTLEAGDAWTIAPQMKDASTGDAVFVVAQRLQGTDGFGGVALLTIDTAVLEKFWAAQKLGADSALNLAREDGILITRFPQANGPVDLKVSSAAWPQIAANASGSFTAASSLDGVTRSVGFRHVPQFKLIVLAAISRDAQVAAIWSASLTVTWLLAPIALALLVGSLLTARILRRNEQAQASLSAALAHNDVLFREIHHRVKNNLQSVSSLLQMQPIPREIKIDMGQRIAAMSAVHEHIYRSSNFSTVEVKGYLETLIENIRAGMQGNVTVVEELEDLAVDKDAAAPLGLIVNEVVSNAFKHAFPGGRQGTITVRLMKRGDGRGELSVADDGIGYDPNAPAKGIGRRLIGALTQQLGGESEVRSGPAGSVFTLVFPLGK